MRNCECGCGGFTNGGSFIPGHDAKMKSELLKAWRLWNDGSALEQLRSRGWLADFDISRTFGVEIEFLVLSDDHLSILVQALANVGIDCRTESYNHTTRGYWKIITDSTVNASGMVGRELVSPVLKGHDGLEQIQKVCEALRVVGATVNVKCGLHVHHDVKNLTINNIKDLYKLYIEHETYIDGMVADSRRGNSNNYCRTLQYRRYQIQSAKSLKGLAKAIGTRYVKLNFESYVKYGTVEFRQHQGTVEATKIIEWIKFGQVMLKAAKRGVRGEYIQDEIEMSRDQLAYWTNRMEQLAS